MPGSAGADPGAACHEPGGSQERGEDRKPVVMLTLAQLARFGERSVRLYLLQRMPSLKRGPACVIPWEAPHQEARSREGGGS